MKTDYYGIDYGMGKTNIDENSIRFGVIPINEVCQSWCDSSELDYGEPACPECEGEVVEYDDEKHIDYEVFHHSCADYVCENCNLILDSSCVYSEEPFCSYLIDDEYKIVSDGDQIDIFIEKSPFFTYAQFCSPCAPGACYLLNPLTDKHENNKCYCLGHDWFEKEKAPYPVYSIKTGKLVKPTR